MEDFKSVSSVHNPGVVKRGDLLITLSTGGKSPALRYKLQKTIERMFGPEWSKRVEILYSKKKAWSDEHVTEKEIARRINAFVDHEEWL